MQFDFPTKLDGDFSNRQNLRLDFLQPTIPKKRLPLGDLRRRSASITYASLWPTRYSFSMPSYPQHLAALR